MILVTKFAQKLTQLVAVLGKIIPATSTLTLAGKTYTGAQLVAAFQDALTLIANVSTTRSAAKQALLAYEAKEPDVHALYSVLGEALRAQLGKGSPILVELGFKTGARSKPSTKTLKAGLDQAKATRLARHTAGRKQKALIKAPVTVPAAVTSGNGTPPGAGGTGPA